MTLTVAVLASADAVNRGHGDWGVWSLVEAGDPTVVATSPDVLDQETTEVLVLDIERHRERAHLAGNLVAAARPDVQVRVATPSTTLGALVTSLERVPAELTQANEVAEHVMAAVSSTVVGAWLPSVTRLERPAPTMGQHVRSLLLRGDGFMALRGESPWVARLPLPQDPSLRLPRDEHGASLVCRAAGELPEAAISALFSVGLAERPHRGRDYADAAAEWGTPHAVEVLLWRPGPALRHAPTGACAVCGQRVWRRCFFCRAVPGPTPATNPHDGPTTDRTVESIRPQGVLG